MCLTLVNYARGSLVEMKVCDESENQEWLLSEGGLFQNSKWDVCLDSKYAREKGITVERCSIVVETQHWNITNHVL